jgi:hypothetical protein
VPDVVFRVDRLKALVLREVDPALEDIVFQLQVEVLFATPGISTTRVSDRLGLIDIGVGDVVAGRNRRFLSWRTSEASAWAKKMSPC